MYSLYIRIVVMRICVIWFPYESYDPLDIGCSLYYLLSKQKPSWTWLDIDVFGVSLGPWVPWPCSPGKRSSTFCSLLPLPFQQHPCLTPIPSRNWPRHRRHARHVAWIEWNWMESNGIRRSASLALFWHGAAWYLITEQVGRKKSMPQICETYETSWNRRTSTVSTKLMVERCSRWFLPKQSQRLKECVTDQPGLKWKPCGAVLNLDGVSDNWGPKGKAPRGCPAASNQDEPSQPSLTLATSLHHFFIHPSYALKSLPESSEFFFWEWHPTWC